MRTITAAITILVLFTLLISGCASKRTVVTPAGNVTVTKKGGEDKKIEVNTKDGKATIDTEKKTISEAELGLPVYPGAVVEMTGDYQSAQGAKESMKQVMLTSKDSFDDVEGFYKSKLKNVENSFSQQTPNGKMAMFSVKASGGASIAMTISEDKKEKVTRIHVVDVKKPAK